MRPGVGSRHREARPGIAQCCIERLVGGDPPREPDRRRGPRGRRPGRWHRPRRRGGAAQRQLGPDTRAGRRRIDVVSRADVIPARELGRTVRRPEREPGRLAEHRAVRIAVAHPGPDARHRARAAHRHAGEAGPRRPPDRRDDGRRPVRRPAAVRPVAGRRGLAGARGGRHPALHGVLPDRRPAGRRAGPQLAPVLHRVGLGVEAAVRARRRLAPGEGPARVVEGPRALRLQRGCAPMGRQGPLADPYAQRAPQPVHGRQAPAGARAQGRGEARSRPEARLDVRRRRADRAAAAGRHDRRPVPRKPDRLQVQPRQQRLPAIGDRREEADRRGHEGPDRAHQRDHHGRPLRPAQRRQQPSPARGTGHGHAARPGSRRTARRSAGPGRRRSSTARRGSSTRTATRSC